MNLLMAPKDKDPILKKVESYIHDHSNITGHTVTIENFSLLGRKDQNLMRTIKEAL